MFFLRWDVYRSNYLGNEAACLCPATETTCAKDRKCWWYEVGWSHTAAQPTQQASRQINSLLMTLHSCYLLSIDDNFPIETRHSKDLLLKPMHSRLKINIWCTNVKDVYLVLRIYTDWFAWMLEIVFDIWDCMAREYFFSHLIVNEFFFLFNNFMLLLNVYLMFSLTLSINFVQCKPKKK